MRQKPRRSQSAGERRIELYVQATIITTISNHRHDSGYRGETEHESSVADDADSSHKIDSRGSHSSSTTYTTVTTTTITTTTTNNNNNNRACNDVEAGGLRARPSVSLKRFRHYREISSAPSSRSIQSGSNAPLSHTAAASLRRQFGYTPRV